MTSSMKAAIWAAVATLVRVVQGWRLARLELAVAEQRVQCDLLLTAEREYGIAYFTNRHIQARCRLARLEEKLRWAEMRRAAEQSTSLKSAALPERPSEAQIADACMWEAHDFGLCDDEEKRRRMFAMCESWRAIWKALNTPGRGGQYVPASSGLENDLP